MCRKYKLLRQPDAGRPGITQAKKTGGQYLGVAAAVQAKRFRR